MHIPSSVVAIWVVVDVCVFASVAVAVEKRVAFIGSMDVDGVVDVAVCPEVALISS